MENVYVSLLEIAQQYTLVSETDISWQYIDPIHKTLYQIYKDGKTENMSDEDYKTELFLILKNLVENNIYALISDTRNFKYTITIEMQTWVIENIFGKNNILKKCAILTSEDFYAQLSLEQVLEDGNKDVFVNRFFDDVHEAIDWAKI